MMSRCQAVAAERSYSISEYPTEYCVGRSVDKEDLNTYGICLPQPCHNDRYRVNFAIEYFHANRKITEVFLHYILICSIS